ncbi:plasmid partitioning/stability family protein [Xenorhabdus innexi]|uniref:InhB n=1 Tax=Xenorhabdus innexi TaxID=290109 RepID=A0A1N6MWJ3_9GAMM
MTTQTPTRQKVISYLQLDHTADRHASQVMSSIPQRERGTFQRNALILMSALHQIDPRLPILITTLYDGKLTPEQLYTLLCQTTGWKPDNAPINTVTSMIPETESTSASPEITETVETSTVYNNLAGKF